MAEMRDASHQRGRLGGAVWRVGCGRVGVRSVTPRRAPGERGRAARKRHKATMEARSKTKSATALQARVRGRNERRKDRDFMRTPNANAASPDPRTPGPPVPRTPGLPVPGPPDPRISNF